MFGKIFTLILFVTFLVFFFPSCSDSTSPSGTSGLSISMIKNMQWDLIAVQAGGSNIDIGDYEPFKLVFWGDKIWASDRCNTLFGNYKITNDTLIINAPIASVACPSLKTFKFEHLSGKPQIKINGLNIVINNKDTLYIYQSKFVMPLPSGKFLNDTLVMSGTDDSLVYVFRSLGLYPKLYISSGREFRIQWFNKLPENTITVNSYSGVFGMNNLGDMLFTRILSSYEGNGSSIDDLKLVSNLTESDKYEYINGKLKLINRLTNTYYEFNK